MQRSPWRRLCEIGAKDSRSLGLMRHLGSMEAEAEDEAIRLSAAGTPVDPGTPLSMVEGGEAVLAEVPADRNIAQRCGGNPRRGAGAPPPSRELEAPDSPQPPRHVGRADAGRQSDDKGRPDTRTAPDTPAAATPAPDPTAPDTPAAPDEDGTGHSEVGGDGGGGGGGEWATPGLRTPRPEPAPEPRVSADQDLAETPPTFAAAVAEVGTPFFGAEKAAEAEAALAAGSEAEATADAAINSRSGGASS